jgi:hypothetical protein
MALSSTGHPPSGAGKPAAYSILFCILTLACLLPANAGAAVTAGWVEQARLIPSGIDLKAKMDTGAKNSSINAQSLELYQSQGEDYARFTVINKAGESVELTLPIMRFAHIKRHFGKTQQRPVVKLTICIGNLVKTAEVNLVDRAGFNYPLLIGRSFMANEFLIDSASTFVLTPSCEARSR